jgi:hypothetical protein
MIIGLWKLETIHLQFETLLSRNRIMDRSLCWDRRGN